MRIGLLILSIFVCIALSQGWIARSYHHATSRALSEDARLAIKLRCGKSGNRAVAECRAMLTKLYLSGSLDPDKTLRAHCEAVKNSRWGGSRPTPPKLCVRRYGGWHEG